MPSAEGKLFNQQLESRMLPAKTVAAATVVLLFSAGAFAQARPGNVDSDPRAVQKCKGMTGAALENCTREAGPAGKNDASPSQASRARPGASPDAAQPVKPEGKGDSTKTK